MPTLVVNAGRTQTFAVKLMNGKQADGVLSFPPTSHNTVCYVLPFEDENS